MNELKTEYCAFNSEFEEMFAYGGDGLIFVRTVAFNGVSWPLKGLLAGFRGSKIKMLSGSNLNTVDIPLSSFMDHFTTRKDFQKAYQIASLGIPDQEMKSLGISALRNKQFNISKKAFTRVKEIGYLDLAIKYERLSGSGEFDELQLYIDILSYEKKYAQAIEHLKKENKLEKAIELCITMKKWNEALTLIQQGKRTGQVTNSKYDMFNLLKMQAEAESAKGNWRAAVDLLISAN